MELNSVLLFVGKEVEKINPVDAVVMNHLGEFNQTHIATIDSMSIIYDKETKLFSFHIMAGMWFVGQSEIEIMQRMLNIVNCANMMLDK